MACIRHNGLLSGLRNVCADARLSLVAGVGALWLVGCGIHYYDPDTGAEHVWGVGHLTMKLSTPTEGVRVAVTGVHLIGIGLGRGETESYMHVGWREARLLRVLQESTCVRLDWPRNDLFSVRVGTLPPGVARETNQGSSLEEGRCSP